MTAAAPDAADSADVMGVRGRPATLRAVGVWSAFLALGLSSGEVSRMGLYLLGFAFLAISAGLILRSHGDLIGRWPTAGVIASCAAVLLCAVASTGVGARGALLPLGAAPAIVLAVLCIRGRPIGAWLGWVGTAVGAVCGSLIAGVSPIDAMVDTVPGTAGVLVMATVFALLVRPRAIRIAALRRLGQRDPDAELISVLREDQIAHLDAQVRPLLEFIASGRRLSDDQVAMCLLVEAGLRDRIRAPGLDSHELADAVWEARARGVRVVLLDDRETPPRGSSSAALERVHHAAVGALTGVGASAQVTVRLLPERRPEFATIVVAEDGQVRRIDFPLLDSAPSDGGADRVDHDVFPGPLAGGGERRFETGGPDRLH